MTKTLIVAPHLVAVRPDGKGYSFSGYDRDHEWPRAAGANLGPVGAFNFFLRLGHVPEWLNLSELDKPGPDDLVVVSASGSLQAGLEARIAAWAETGSTVLLSGRMTAFASLIGSTGTKERRPHHPGGGLGLIASKGGAVRVLAPPSWPFVTALGREGFGQLAEISGDRQSPRRALIRPIDGAYGALPLLRTRGGLWFLNGQPFAALQAWLQAQEDLSPWLGWGNRMTWLDEYVDTYASNLEGWLGRSLRRRYLIGVPKTTLTLRHDTDCSVDDTYLGVEEAHEVTATWPILDDANAHFWAARLSRSPGHEAAFHYSSIYRPLRARSLLMAALRRFGRPVSERLRPAGRQVGSGGLLRQLRRAAAHGITTSTIHRHFGFIQYPEIIDALDSVYREAGTIGSSTFFQAQVLRWGAGEVDGATSTSTIGPDVLTPYWFPFRLAHAAEGGRMLEGWEATTAIEAEPGLVRQLMNPRNGLPHQHVTLTYHPAHGHSDAFVPGGCLGWLEQVLADAVREGWQIATYVDLLGLVDEALKCQAGEAMQMARFNVVSKDASATP